MAARFSLPFYLLLLMKLSMVNLQSPVRILAASIRIVSFLFGCFIIVASIPIAFIGGAMPQETIPAVSPLLTVPLAACVLASGFLSFALFGGRAVNSLRQRVITTLLLMLPLALGASQLLSTIHPEMRGIGLFLFVPASAALVCSLWPCHASKSFDARPSE